MRLPAPRPPPQGQVVVLDVDRPGLDAVATDHPTSRRAISMSAIALRVASAFGAIEQQFGKIDGLVCCAAIQPRISVHDMDPRAMASGAADQSRWRGLVLSGRHRWHGRTPQWQHRGLFLRARAPGLAAGIRLRRKQGRTDRLRQERRKEVAGHRVRFNLIAPGVIDTPQYRAANAGEDNERWKASTGVGEPEDVVGPLMFLLSDAATMTASLLNRDTVYPASDPQAEELP